MSAGNALCNALQDQNGVQVDQSEVEQWVKELGDRLALDPSAVFKNTFITSGNMLVVGILNPLRDEPDRVIVEAYVCKIERHGSVVCHRSLAPQASQSGQFCSCALPKLKRVDISSALSYSFCEICKKEKK